MQGLTSKLSGGLGHFAVLWAVALGAEVYALSHTADKKDDILKMGAKQFVLTTEKDWHKPLAWTLDFIINTSDMYHTFNIPDYLSTMKIGGRFHNVGVGDQPLPSLKAQDFMPGMYYFGTSHIGNRPEMLAMLKLASDKKIKSWVETIDVSEEGCKEAVERVSKGDVRYRFTLINFDKAFGKRA